MEQITSTLMMLGLVSLLIIAHELGHFWVARRCGIKVERFALGLPFGPMIWSTQVGETEVGIHWALFGGYVAFPDDNPDSKVPKDSPERFENAGWWQRFAVAIAGITVNAIMGWAMMVMVAMVWGMPGVDAIRIADLINDDSPAAVAGIQPGDEIVAVRGKKLSEFAKSRRMNAVLGDIKSSAGKPVKLTVRRGEEQLPITVVPAEDTGLIGVHLQPVASPITPYTNVIAASRDAGLFLSDFVVQNFQALGGLITGKVSGDQLSGPIRIIEQGGKAIQQHGIQNGLVLAAILSVILAVMNLLPIPALDGGHILFLLIEAIKGSPVKPAIQEGVTQVGFLALLLLMGAVVFNDVWQLLPR